MTPDESAWTQFEQKLRRDRYWVLADVVAEVRAELRKRRAAGALGPQVEQWPVGGPVECVMAPPPEASVQARADEARWLQEVMKRKQAERERDEARERSRRLSEENEDLQDRMLMGGRERAALEERLNVSESERGFALTARDEAEGQLRDAETRLGESERNLRVERTCRDGVESLLGEALGVLERASFQPDLTPRCVLGTDIRDVLAKAKAAGYGVEP